MANLIHDTHFHLDLFNDQFVKIANQIEKKKIYTIAVTNLPPLYTNLINKLNNKYKFIRPALGFHPELLDKYQNLIPKMWELLPQARYIGEVGLDYKTGISYKSEQVKFFETLIEKCHHQGDKILTIHSRRSAEDIVSIIGNNFNSKFILHWYSGNIRTLKNALNIGAYFSINYSMTQSKSGNKIISEIPLKRMLLESDGPFILYENKPFTPTFNYKVIKRLSEILNIKEEELNIILSRNFKNLLTQ